MNSTLVWHCVHHSGPPWMVVEGVLENVVRVEDAIRIPASFSLSWGGDLNLRLKNFPKRIKDEAANECG